MQEELVLELLLVEGAVGRGLGLDLGLHGIRLAGALSGLGSLALGLLSSRERLLPLRRQALHHGAITVDGHGSFALSLDGGWQHRERRWALAESRSRVEAARAHHVERAPGLGGPLLAAVPRPGTRAFAGALDRRWNLQLPPASGHRTWRLDHLLLVLHVLLLGKLSLLLLVLRLQIWNHFLLLLLVDDLLLDLFAFRKEHLLLLLLTVDLRLLLYLVLLVTLLLHRLLLSELLRLSGLLLLEHHELLLLLEQSLELLFVQLVQELFAQDWHLYEVSWLHLAGGNLILAWTDDLVLLHGLLDLGGLAQLLLGERSGSWRDAAFLLQSHLLLL